MPTPTFQRLTIEQFELLLQKFPFTRKIDAMHMHHTWRPRHTDFRGHETIVSMWQHHTQTNGWSDIAQHITIDPDGMIWLGRNWNLPPASARGHNGNGDVGPFMFEMIGDFDRGRDPFDGKQKDTALKVVAMVQLKFRLPITSLRFHNAMSPKSCPGTSVNYEDILREVEREREELGTTSARGASGTTLFPDEAGLAIQDAIRSLGRVTDNTGESGDAEPEHEHEPAMDGARTAVGAVGRGSGLDTATLMEMRPHLINLRAGRFSNEGEVTSTPEEVNTIFEEHLPAALKESGNSGKLRIVLFAHGGLVSESSGLQIAYKHIGWWRKNGVYPIYFVWETGLFETLGQMLERARQGTRAVTRDLADYTTDPLIEVAARALQGPRIWGGMKWSAERAVDPPTTSDPFSGGGAHYVATRLKAFCEAHGDRVELHAVGHSAGSIFHSYFLPLAHKLGVPTFASAHLMAPAVRVDTFKQQLLGAIGGGEAARHLTLYTMQRDYERKDNCSHVYRKSLLYLIYYALEDERKTPILGLEESLRADGALKKFFGLDGSKSATGEVVWSVSASDTGNSASRSTSHGGFDDDAPTMNSIAHRVLGKPDAAAIVPYSTSRVPTRQWIEEVDWPYGFVQTPPATQGTMALPWQTPPAPAPQPLVSAPMISVKATGGRRIALCVGIDAYPDVQHRLAGCVNDARTWAGTLNSLGFETRFLLDGDATRGSLDRELTRLVTESRPGDVIVFQYAGHGTKVPDLDGDEEDSIDEALCPVDFASGALYIDDDISELFARIPDGVNMTCFMDCCHSGTNTRFAVGLSPEELARPPGTKPRFVPTTADIVEAHKRLRGARRAAPTVGGTGGRRRMRDVKFSACLDHQVALESGGNGEFTRRATRVLGRGTSGQTHDQFLRGVLAEFGSGARQDPMLDCMDEVRGSLLLQPLTSGGRSAFGSAFAQPAGADGTLLQAVNVLAHAVQALSAR